MIRDFRLFWSLPEFIGAVLEDIPKCPEWLVFVPACLLVGAVGLMFGA